jgi:phosphoglycerol transferase MdoB-like AlkP superfamily enzyme
VLLPTLALIAAGFYIKSKSSKTLFHMVGVIICIYTAILLNQYIYKSPEIYKALPANGPRYHVTSNFNSKGFIYCFLYNLNTYSIEAPKNYNKQYAENLSKKYASKEKRTPQKKPHIIMIMSEAFSDIAMHDTIVFTSENDPLKNFKRISEAGLSGHIIVPGFGGGTANTEYDVLTGCMTQGLSDTPTSAFRLVRKDFNALPRFFNRNGYRTSFIHPGNSWFYNRSNVYKYFGIDNQTFIDKFAKPQDYKGTLISDKAVIEKIIKIYKTHLASYKNIPLFSFTVTIQNHMPYRNYKYRSQKVEPVKTKYQISDKASELLSNYITGLRDSDRSLGRLVDFFERSNEPVVFVFFGDHMPYLGEDYLAYKELGYRINQNGSVEDIISIHSVPFVIWANAKANTDIGFAKAINNLNLPPNRIISANYLGSILYELLGYKGVEPFYDFLGELRRSIPVITGSYYKTKSGYIMQLPGKLNMKMQDYRKWQYYKMSSDKVKN